jgi:hypothetical protein
MWWKAALSLPGVKSFADIWALDLEAATMAAKRMNLGTPHRNRNLVPEYRPSRLMQLPGGLGRADVLHSLCYLSMLADRAGVVQPYDLIGEFSPFHELAHYLGAGGGIRGGKQRSLVIERIRWLESLVPGMPPDSVDLAPAVAIDERGRVAENQINSV